MSLESAGLFTKMFQRLESMERNIVNKMTILERKVDMKNLQQLKVTSVSQNAVHPKWESIPVAVISKPEMPQQIYKIVRKV